MPVSTHFVTLKGLYGTTNTSIRIWGKKKLGTINYSFETKKAVVVLVRVEASPGYLYSVPTHAVT